MKFDEIHRLVRGVPFITEVNARYLYDLILRERPAQILELGIAHGTATCYMAAALDEIGAGRITAVDLTGAADQFQPTPEAQLARAGLSRWVGIERTQTGYNWFLHDEIRRRTADGICHPAYDLCIIDGAKNWTIDGCAFFLAEKLLNENGWLIFDDYDWTYAATDPKREATDGVSHRALSEAERTTPHVREIFELLVVPHPHFSRFFVSASRDWAVARKVAADHKTYIIEHRETWKAWMLRQLRALKRRRIGPAKPGTQ